MKEYTVRFGQNTLNKNGDRTKESDLLYTENTLLKKSGILESQNSEYAQHPPFDLTTENLQYAQFVNSKAIPFRHVGIYTNGYQEMGIYSLSYNTNSFEKMASVSGFTGGKKKGCSVFINGFNMYFTIGYGYIPDSGVPAETQCYYKWDMDMISTPSLVTLAGGSLKLNNIVPYYNYFVGSGQTDNKHLLFYSAPELPEDFSISDYIVVGNNDEEIIATVPYNGYLYIFKEKSIYILSGGSPQEYRLTELITDFGIFSSSSYCVKNNKLFFINSIMEMYVVDGGNIKKVMDKRDILSLFSMDNKLSDNEEPLLNVSSLTSFLYSGGLVDCNMYSDDTIINGFYFSFYHDIKEGIVFWSTASNLWGFYDVEFDNASRITNSIKDGIRNLTLKHIFINQNANEKVYVKYGEPATGSIPVFEYTIWTRDNANYIDNLYCPKHILSGTTIGSDEFSKENVILTTKLLDDGIDKKLKYIKISGLFAQAKILIFSDWRDDLDVTNLFTDETIKNIIRHKENVKYDYFSNTGKLSVINIDRQDFVDNKRPVFGSPITAVDLYVMLDVNKSIRIKPIVGKYFMVLAFLYFQPDEKYKGTYSKTKPNLRKMTLGFDELPRRNKKY